MRKTDRCQTTELRDVRLLNLAKVETKSSVGMDWSEWAKDMEAASGDHSFGGFAGKEARRRRNLRSILLSFLF